MQPHAETPRQPASTLPYRSDITEGAAILARMIEDMRGAEELVRSPHRALKGRAMRHPLLPALSLVAALLVGWHVAIPVFAKVL